MVDNTVTLAAPAKLNLRLRIVGRRADGLHLLEGESVLIDLADEVRLRTRADAKIVRDWRHPQVSDDADLAMRAALLLRELSGKPQLGASICVRKRIPPGGGLGGGSSDAATVLLGLNRLWALNLPTATLMAAAAQLGADVPFFLFGRAASIGGCGEILSPWRARRCYYLLVFPAVVALTKAVYEKYRNLTRTAKSGKIPPLFKNSENDLTPAALQLYPAILSAATALHQVAANVRLSGSGSTVFAAFDKKADALGAQAALSNELRSFVATALMQHPLSVVSDGE